MARPTVGDVYRAAAAHAGDFSGQYYNDTVPGSRLDPFFAVAYSELFRASQSMQNPRVRQVNFYDLPAYTSVLDPATAGIFNLGEPELIEERGSVTEVAITGAVPGSGFLTITAVGHPFVSGDQAVQFGILGLSSDANGVFTVTKTGANTYTANGCAATGTYTSGGTAAKSTERFAEVIGPREISEVLSAPQSILGEFSWDNDIFRFPPCSALRQLRITYTLSGSAPTEDVTIPFDDSKDFLSLRTAGLALKARGNRDKANELNELAVGPDWGRGISGGILDQLLGAGVKNLQNQPQEELRSASAYGRQNSLRIL